METKQETKKEWNDNWLQKMNRYEKVERAVLIAGAAVLGLLIDALLIALSIEVFPIVAVLFTIAAIPLSALIAAGGGGIFSKKKTEISQYPDDYHDRPWE